MMTTAPATRPARRHHSGLKRKRILPVDFREPIDYL
jgi:hypothetical protein